MKKLRTFWKRNGKLVLLIASALVLTGGLFYYRLGSLTNGLSRQEVHAASAVYGWHGIYQNPFYLPLQVARSIIFLIPGHHGQLLTRLPNTLFGIIAVFLFANIVRLWHGTRTALLSTALFGTSAWLLHVSRLASYDVIYLVACLLLVTIVTIGQRLRERPLLQWLSISTLSVLLFIPGLIAPILLTVYWQRKNFAFILLRATDLRNKIINIALFVIWLPLLILQLTRHDQWRVWLGLPTKFPHLHDLIKQFLAVPVHLFIRGPQYPDTWLARAPILDIFTLVVCITGIYFYVLHYKVHRSRVLLSYFLLGLILVGLGGSASLSLVIPLAYLCASTGIAYLLHDWLKVFPINPLARAVGIGLISIAVALSCVYNLRAYFVAWPHNVVTAATFRYHR